ncbi:alpha-1,6-mannosyl-glycoprotein 2-beta-N-acetylglucosaminyltransferase isoform X2 [Plutella xylostella]|uniref:alpha-1,6-mannosyl-glycoprotein 2-beta-N-acetylglucosaminyltransferase isoform X2 n=1 Tax=Plutella xylostella TaxID=51655 RepID=UPI0020322771|nr:alpha-1,6-mannosyl-glycoprotein 2-beta-N-acetylglucosaminyltransferase isoform X2 [Plutella xylostella]
MPRLKYASILRVLVLVGLLCIWIQIMLAASSSGLDRDGDTTYSYTNDVTETDVYTLITNDEIISRDMMNINETSEQVLALVPQELHKYLLVHPKNVTGNSTERAGPKNITSIRRAIERSNDAQTIYNEDIFGPVQNDTVIIAIQVHTRITYLRHLIVSLAQAKDIERTLLIFSHDYYDEEVNDLVRSIDFTKVMQIFYPYSIQTHPNEFPGVDPNDCPRNFKYNKALKQKCNNALHPDVHGHYREAKYTQTKHHWWWKANRIFNQLQCTTTHTGPVLFLEEDHYVAEDFLHMLALLRNTADKTCPQCEILCLGTYLKTYQYHLNSDKRRKQLTLTYLQQLRVANEERRRRQDTQAWNFQVYPNLYGSTQKVEITPWHSSMHNMGMAFNQTVWASIMAHQDQFCAYDDYNWDYSLLHLSQNRGAVGKFKVMLCKGPRVFHIGECGIHHKKSNCNASTVIGKVQKLLQTASSHLYPSRVTATVTFGGAKHNKKLLKGNGGWGDIRDQELCANMTREGRQMKKYFFT